MKTLRRPFSIRHFPRRTLPVIVLWICMLVTGGIFAVFYYGIINGSDQSEIAGIGFILNWLYLIFILTLGIACFFSFIRFFIRWKRNPRSILQPLILITALISLLAGAYMSGNGNPLLIPGYNGNENTAFWLKLTDMWLYSLYILLILAVISLFCGIIWSYIKRTR
ncbi:MAG: hypothetical protein LBP72_07440 [Dysgonamonadaceae bacterium]|jgi:cation transporter-like permease|nr:hypothetical protein [Dysgonamonadaceae bacterium]